MSKELDAQMKKLMRQSAQHIKKQEQTDRTDPVAEVLTGMTQAEFIKDFAPKCDNKEDWKCSQTGYACKDYLCPRLIKRRK